MSRNTIDFGIDLGTTNSEIAVLKGTQVEIFKNNENDEFTPSVVWIRDNRIVVGRRAKEHLFEDPDNVHCEFKLRMGTTEEFTFKKAGRKMKPEELSAEVLKSLKSDVKQRTGEDVAAAVITVPADFNLPQNQATRRAAELAGFGQSPLLHEPAAAALAYGFQSKDDKVFWMVYDFGGGTFDAALIQLRDGQIDVINHGGDNQLGGKLIDWAIVDQILAPAVARQHSLQDFQRGNPRWRTAFARLKSRAEAAKIGLSRMESADIYIDPLCKDAEDQDVAFEFELKRSEVQRMMDPFIERSINITRKVIQEANLKAGSIEKLLLVGGPTMTPHLRDRLGDKKSGLGIPLEFGVDPLTIVARGAAIFAGTRILERPKAAPGPGGKFSVQLKYDPITRDEEPPIAGKVTAPAGENLAGYTIEFINKTSKPGWRSGQIPLPIQGGFAGSLLVRGEEANVFSIELKDPAGTQKETDPVEFDIKPGNPPVAAPMTHSVGVAMANGETDFFITKGTKLPAKRRQVHTTVREAKKGAQEIVKIPVVEGQSQKADRNRLIGFLEIPAREIRRDLPAGSEIEITILVDESRQVTSKAYIPFLDQEFEKVFRIEIKKMPQDQLDNEVRYVKQRLETLRQKLEERSKESPGDPDLAKAEKVMSRVETERLREDVEETYKNARISEEEADKCGLRIQALNLALDEIEDLLLWPDLKAQVDFWIDFSDKVLADFGTEKEKKRAQTLGPACREGLKVRDQGVVKAKLAELKQLTFEVWARDPSYWVTWFQDLEKKQDVMTDSEKAQKLLNNGRVAINGGDVEALKSVIRQLLGLLPPDERARQDDKYPADTIKK